MDCPSISSAPCSTVTQADLWLIVGLSLVVLVIALGLSPQIFALAADEEYARTLGIPVRAYSIVMVVIAAVTVALSMRTVGLLLVSALMVIPVAAANNMVRSYHASMRTALLLGMFSALGGVVASYYLDAAPGATIVLMAIALFVLSWPIGSLAAHRRAALPTVEEREQLPHEQTPVPHPHIHSDTCGHTRLQHEDHYDYVHDGHRHAAHEDHYDEH